MAVLALKQWFSLKFMHCASKVHNLLISMILIVEVSSKHHCKLDNFQKIYISSIFFDFELFLNVTQLYIALQLNFRNKGCNFWKLILVWELVYNSGFLNVCVCLRLCVCMCVFACLLYCREELPLISFDQIRKTSIKSMNNFWLPKCSKLLWKSSMKSLSDSQFFVQSCNRNEKNFGWELLHLNLESNAFKLESSEFLTIYQLQYQRKKISRKFICWFGSTPKVFSSAVFLEN